MPKLNAKQTKELKKAASENSFEPLDDGVYHARLLECVRSEQPGNSGFHYWKWKFAVVEEPYVNRQLFTNTSESPAAAFKMEEAYDAFDSEFGSDTDELLGQVCKLVISQKTIQEGDKKGEIGNEIIRIASADEDYEVPETAGAGGKKGGSDLF